MSAPNPQVSVFHFSSNVSKAKIRKYKLATERGMAPEHNTSDQGNTNSKNLRGNLSTASKESQLSSLGPPPSKKRRLKLNVRPRRSESPGDTIAVALPKQAPAVNIRSSNEGISLPQNGNEEEVIPPRSLSPPISVESSSSSKGPESKNTKKDYGDFMSYYVIGGDEDDEPEAAVSKLPRARTKSLPLKQTAPEQQQPPAKSTSQSQIHKEPAPKKIRRSVSHIAPLRPMPTFPIGSQTHHHHHHHRNHHHHHPPLPHPPPLPHLHPPPPPPPHHHHHHHRHMHPVHQPPVLPQPTIQFVDIPTQPKSTRPDTVLEMIDKLSKLSTALTNFEAGHPVHKAAITQPAQEWHPRANEALDKFLAHFEEGAPTEFKDLSMPLASPGVPDHSLMYGIEFIQNALKSWAQQRLTQDMMHHLQQQQQAAQMYRANQPLNGEAGLKLPEFAFPPGPIQLNLADTLEGAAIAAFQSVLDSGCLQMNALYPTELIGALRRLYVQIDHLINQGAAKTQTPWVCMSYQSQIAANKVRVEKWKEANARAQEETTRQQQIAQQHIMMQMGLNGHAPQMPPHAVQARHAHAIELDRRRSLQHATTQPYISQQHLNAGQFSRHDSRDANNGSNPPAMAEVRSAGPIKQTGPLPGVNGHTFTDISNLPPSFNGAGPGQVQLDKMKLYMPGFLPRSGQSMKFSFAPSNEAALQAFGSQAFPAKQNRLDAPKRESIPSGPVSLATSQPETSHEQESKKPISSASISSKVAPAPLSAPASAPVATRAPATVVPDVPAAPANTEESDAAMVDQPKVRKSRTAVSGRGVQRPTPAVNSFTSINGSRRAADAPSNNSAPEDGAESSEEDTIHVAIKTSPGLTDSSMSGGDD